MGFLLLLGLLAVTGAGLWWAGQLRGAALQMTLAALMIGAAGYALQSRPSLAGAPKAVGTNVPPVSLTEPRQAMLGQFTSSERWMTIADSYARRGDTQGAVDIIRAALKEHPNDAALYVGLGNALVDHGAMLTPAATLAYARARELAPKLPAPLFFEGLALARSGKQAEALALWQRALALTPPGTSYHQMIEMGVKMLSAQAQAGSSPPPPGNIPSGR